MKKNKTKNEKRTREIRKNNEVFFMDRGVDVDNIVEMYSCCKKTQRTNTPMIRS